MQKLYKNEYIVLLPKILYWIGDKSWSMIILPMVYFLLICHLIGVIITGIFFGGMIVGFWDLTLVHNFLDYLRGR